MFTQSVHQICHQKALPQSNIWEPCLFTTMTTTADQLMRARWRFGLPKTRLKVLFILLNTDKYNLQYIV